jgi:hypothetical protein
MAAAEGEEMKRRKSTPETRAFGSAYYNHKMDAGRRGISFLLSFEQWLEIWVASGRLAERGPRKGQYVMARFGDKGPYVVGNVKIIQVEENLREYWDRAGAREQLAQRSLGHQYNVGRKASAETRRKMSLAQLGNKYCAGRKVSEETRKKISLKLSGRKLTGEAKKRHLGNKYNLGRKWSEATKKKLSDARFRYWERRRKQQEATC